LDSVEGVYENKICLTFYKKYKKNKEEMKELVKLERKILK